MTTSLEFAAQSLRARQEQNMPSRCYFERLTATPVPGGATRNTWARVDVLTHPCRLASLTMRERLTGQQVQNPTTARIVLPAGTTVDAKWRAVVVGETGGEAWSKTFAILSVLAPASVEIVRTLLVTDWTEGR